MSTIRKLEGIYLPGNIFWFRQGKDGRHSGLGILRAFSYSARVIGFLRFVGILNAAVWFGGAVFFTFWSGRAPFSPEMKALLGPQNYPYFSGAIAQILIARYFNLQFTCSIIAV